jgi:hypothetical protein
MTLRPWQVQNTFLDKTIQQIFKDFRTNPSSGLQERYLYLFRMKSEILDANFKIERR